MNVSIVAILSRLVLRNASTSGDLLNWHQSGYRRPCVPCRLSEAAEVLRIGKTKLHLIIRSGELPTVQIGRRRMVRRETLEAYIEANERS